MSFKKCLAVINVVVVIKNKSGVENKIIRINLNLFLPFSVNHTNDVYNF